MGFFYLRKYKNILESFISPFLQSGVLLSSLLAEVWVPLEAVNDSLRASSESPEELSVCTHQESSAPACTHPSCWVSFTNISWGCSLSSPLSRNKSFLRAAAWGVTGEMELRLFPLWGCVLSGWAPCTQDLSWAELGQLWVLPLARGSDCSGPPLGSTSQKQPLEITFGQWFGV